MRWIFFSLLILNAATLVWGFVFEEETLPQQHVEKPFPFKNVETLSLLGEGQSEVIAVANRQSVQRLEKSTKPGGLPNKVDGKPLCEMIGPFKSRDAAQDFRERLSAIDVKADVKDLELPAGAGYWVYLAPFPNRKAAISQYTELQAQKIDSYVIPKGERQNGISLGMFSQENLARKKFKEMQDRGLNPQLDTIERTYREIWVMLEHNEESKMSDLTWTRIMEGLNQLERRQNFCLDVAS